jgi:hypothetical protein
MTKAARHLKEALSYQIPSVFAAKSILMLHNLPKEG